MVPKPIEASPERQAAPISCDVLRQELEGGDELIPRRCITRLLRPTSVRHEQGRIRLQRRPVLLRTAVGPGPKLLAAVLLGSVISGCHQNQDLHYPEARLDFTQMQDGPAPLAVGSGTATIITTPGGDPTARFHIRNGLLTTDPTVEGPTASYLTAPSLGTPVTNFGASWSFTGKDQPSGSIMLFVSQHVASPPWSVRLQISRSGWSVGLQAEGDIASSEGEILASAPFAKPLKADSETVYDCSVSIAGERVEVSLPTGERKVVRDQRFAEWAGPFATFAAFQPNGADGSQIGFRDVWAESRAGG